MLDHVFFPLIKYERFENETSKHFFFWNYKAFVIVIIILSKNFVHILKGFSKNFNEIKVCK